VILDYEGSQLAHDMILINGLPSYKYLTFFDFGWERGMKHEKLQ
jgi:hypothetical protein